MLARDAREIFRAALAGADASIAVERALVRRGAVLSLRGGGGRYDLRRVRRVMVVGAGKAAGPMTAALERVLGPWGARKIAGGLVLVPPEDRTRLGLVRKRAASHPIPSRGGAEGASQILGVLRTATADDLVIALISGGVSAMAALPVSGVSLGELQKMTALLLRSGASIAEINAVRKHLTLATGGRMAEAAAPARVLVLVVSDVEGNRLHVIGSGPFAPDPSTFADAERVLRHYRLWRGCPAAVRAEIAGVGAGAAAIVRVGETPKPGARCFARVRHVVVADRSSAVAAAERRARELGYGVRALASEAAAFGPIERVARAHVRAARAEIARVARGRGRGRGANAGPAVGARSRSGAGADSARAACLLSSGEAQVEIPPGCCGRGGRNQELALRLAAALIAPAARRRRAGTARGPAKIPPTAAAALIAPQIAILCAGTDGIDGPTDAAGACVDAEVLRAAARAGLDPARFIEAHDSYRFFKRAGGLVITGRTGTNLLDLRILLFAPARPRRRLTNFPADC